MIYMAQTFEEIALVEGDAAQVPVALEIVKGEVE